MELALRNSKALGPASARKRRRENDDEDEDFDEYLQRCIEWKCGKWNNLQEYREVGGNLIAAYCCHKSARLANSVMDSWHPVRSNLLNRSCRTAPAGRWSKLVVQWQVQPSASPHGSRTNLSWHPTGTRRRETRRFQSLKLPCWGNLPVIGKSWWWNHITSWSRTSTPAPSLQHTYFNLQYSAVLQCRIHRIHTVCQKCRQQLFWPKICWVGWKILSRKM